MLRRPDLKKIGTCKFVSPTYRPPLPQGHTAAGWIMLTKIFSDTIVNRTLDLATCSAVPQPTLPSHVDNVHSTFGLVRSHFIWPTVYVTIMLYVFG